ncbi:hypothetical protein MED222_05920 [Vibrio sp. MED222]|nr:hypothetical protein MED222_05920 [Vibrio sp. MED222]
MSSIAANEAILNVETACGSSDKPYLLFTSPAIL